MGKISLLIGGAAGYVLGARAGREQYDKMVAEARKLWRDPRVQEKAAQAQHAADDMASRAEDTVVDKVAQHTGNHSDSSAGSASPGGTTGGPSSSDGPPTSTGGGPRV